MRTKLLLRFLMFFLMFFLSSCVHTPKQTQTKNNWTIKGKIAASQHTAGIQAAFDWIQQGDAYKITLLGPLGIRYACLTKAAHTSEVTLQTPKKTMTAHSAQALLYRATHISLPVNSLVYWLQGKPDPNIRIDHQQSHQGYLQKLQQSGWNIEFLDYANHLPSFINLQHQKEAIKLKLVITSRETPR